MELREAKIGEYTVREVPMRKTMEILRKYPEDSPDRGPAMLGASVFNGTGEPLGMDVLDLGTGLYQALMDAYNRVNSKPVPDDEVGNG